MNYNNTTIHADKIKILSLSCMEGNALNIVYNRWQGIDNESHQYNKGIDTGIKEM